jgi:hypothetical protein
LYTVIKNKVFLTSRNWGSAKRPARAGLQRTDKKPSRKLTKKQYGHEKSKAGHFLIESTSLPRTATKTS